MALEQWGELVAKLEKPTVAVPVGQGADLANQPEAGSL